MKILLLPRKMLFLFVLMMGVGLLSFGAEAKEEGGTSSDYQKGIALYNKGDFTTAIQYFKKASEQGDSRADFDLGLMNLYARGTDVNDEKAFYYFEKSAKEGNNGALFLLGRMYLEGVGVPKNTQKAIDIYRKEAHKGNAFFQYLLGNYYAKGIYVVKDTEKAMYWLLKASKNGAVRADLLLGHLYEFDIKDSDKASQHYQKAADAGNVKAIFKLAPFEGDYIVRNSLADENNDIWVMRAIGYGDENALYEIVDFYEGIKRGKDLSWIRQNAGFADVNSISFDDDDDMSARLVYLLFIFVLSLFFIVMFGLLFKGWFMAKKR